MRVIAGAVKGRILQGVPGDSTRPISDRVKESLFSILDAQDALEGCRILDLFGGTGAVGIEALSRGAAHVTFCEKDRRALAVLRQNLTSTGLAERAEVIAGDAFSFLQRLGMASAPAAFDLIYLAPPQYRQLWERALTLVDAHPRLLAPDGWVIVQIHPKEDRPLALAALVRSDERNYGSTRLIFYRHTPAD